MKLGAGRRRSVTIVIGGLLIALAGCAASTTTEVGLPPESSAVSTSPTTVAKPPATTSSGTSAADRAHLIQIAEKSATVNGDPKPKSVQWVRAERGPIAKLLEFGLGDADNPKLSEYLILPTGTYITLVVNPSWEVTDFGIGNQKIDLSSIGTVERK